MNDSEPTLWQSLKELGMVALCLFAYPGLQMLGDWLL